MEYEESQNYNERNARAGALLVRTMQDLNSAGAGREVNERFQRMLAQYYTDNCVLDKVVDKLLDDINRED